MKVDTLLGQLCCESMCLVCRAQRFFLPWAVFFSLSYRPDVLPGRHMLHAGFGVEDAVRLWRACTRVSVFVRACLGTVVRLGQMICMICMIYSHYTLHYSTTVHHLDLTARADRFLICMT